MGNEKSSPPGLEDKNSDISLSLLNEASPASASPQGSSLGANDRRIANPASVLRMQRVIGNQAVMRQLQSQGHITGNSTAIQRNFLTDWQNKREQKKLDKASKDLPAPMVKKQGSGPTKDSKTVGGLEEASGVGSSLLGVADSTLAQTSSTPKNFATGSNMDISAGNSNFNSDTDTQSIHGTNSSTGSSGVGIGTGALATISHMAGFVQAINKAKSGETKRERGDAKLDAAQHGLQTATSAGQSGANYAGMVTNLAGSSPGNNTSTGIADILGGVGDSIELMFTIGKGTRNLLKDLEAAKGDKNAKREVWLEARSNIAKGALPGINKILGVGLSIMSGVRYILTAWNAGGPFVDAFPIIGASIGIFMKLLNIVMSLLQIMKRVKSILKAIINATAVAAGKAATKIADTTVELLQEVNKKRKIRAQALIFTEAVRIIGDFTGIAGNILQIVGVATAPAYGGGAGVYAAGIATTAAGALLKVGASGIEGGMAATRFIKQKGRDYTAEKEAKQGGRKANIMGIHFNTDKSTEKKHQRYATAADDILDSIGKLHPLDDTKEAEYKNILEVLRATGVDKKELFKTNDWAKAQGLLIEAMKQRE